MNLGNVLITGGAGYIGSHVVKALSKTQTARRIVLDDLSSGFSESVIDAKLILGNIQDIALVTRILQTEKIDAVMHFAASTVLPESIENPLKYYQNNTLGTLHLLKACVDCGVRHFVFSSTAAVYGPSSEKMLSEQNETRPVNPYGHSKLMCEQIIQDVAHAHSLNYVILRYFNVAGADPEGQIGQKTANASHLIKAAVETACGLKESLPIYGNDYPTPDGSCVRDFIHVSDLSDAHIQALDYLQKGGASITLNCGYGQGVSVYQVIKALEDLTQSPLKTTMAPRRIGDLASVIADPTLIHKTLDWDPKYNDLHFIIQTALAFESTFR